MTRLLSALWPLLWLLVLLAALRGLGLWAVLASDRVVLFLLVVVWVPLTLVLFRRARQRRAMWLAACLKVESRWRRCLRGGALMLVVQALLALPLALLLLAIISQPPPAQLWTLLLLAAPLWWGCRALARRILRRDVHAPFQPVLADIMALRVAGVLLLLAWLVWSLWQPLADLSALTLWQAARLGQAEAVGESSLLRGGAAVWHGLGFVQLWLVQALTEGLQASLLSVLAWCLLLLQGACFIWPVLLLMEGVMSPVAVHRALQTPVVQKPMVALMLVLPLVMLLASIIAAERPPRWWHLDRQVVELQGQRYLIAEDHLQTLLDDNADWLQGDLAERARQLGRLADDGLVQLFADARARVPDYADWHYSLAGGMTRTAFGLMDYLDADPDRAARLLTGHLFPAPIWSRRLADFETTMAEGYRAQWQSLQGDLITDLQRRLVGHELHPHWRVAAGEVVRLEERIHDWRDTPLQTQRALEQSGLAATLGAGAAAVSLTRSVAAAARTRATTGTAARAGARLAGRSSAAGGATLCAASGPLAFGCALVVFTSVTLASEYAILKTDELLSRQQLERDLLASLDALQQAAREEYLAALMAALRADAEAYQQQVADTLRPIDRF